MFNNLNWGDCLVREFAFSQVRNDTNLARLFNNLFCTEDLHHKFSGDESPQALALVEGAELTLDGLMPPYL